MTSNSMPKLQAKPHLAAAALSAFILSFIAARTFTTFFPSTVIVTSGIHIHHFWYGIALLAIGGWIGISYNNRETDLVAAVIYGAGGGLIADEVGLLLTFGNYWTNLTYTAITVFLSLIGVLMIVVRYRQVIKTELAEYIRSKISLYFAIFLLAVSVAFTTETTNLGITVVSTSLTIASTIIIIFHRLQRTKKTPKKLRN
jgi:hypothetical protein